MWWVGYLRMYMSMVERAYETLSDRRSVRFERRGLFARKSARALANVWKDTPLASPAAAAQQSFKGPTTNDLPKVLVEVL